MQHALWPNESTRQELLTLTIAVGVMVCHVRHLRGEEPVRHTETQPLACCLPS